MNNKYKHSGNITIGRYSGTKTVHISIEDEESRVVFFDGEMDVESFALELTNMSNMKIEFNLRPDMVGKTKQWKVVEVQMPECDYDNLESTARKVVSECEFDGWMGEWRDCLNHHNRISGTNRYKVTFVRYVEEP